MTAPGVIIEEVEPLAAKRSPTATDAWFVVGPAKRGPIGPLALSGAGDVKKLGDYIPEGQVREAAEWFFDNGGEYLVFSRLVGPAPVFGGTTIMAAAGAGNPALTFAMREPGAWTAGWKSKVIAVDADSIKVQFIDPDGNVFLETPQFDSAADAVTWSADSPFVKFTDPGAAHWPPVQAAATAFTTQGDDDLDSAGDAQIGEALARLVKELGIGQVSVLGHTTTTVHDLLAAHVDATNRVAVGDLPDTSTVATLTGISSASRTAAKDSGARRTGLFGGSWVLSPGATPVDAKRVLPLSAIVATKCAQNDLAGVPISQPPAGAHGQIDGALGLSQPQPAFTDDQRDTLNEASVNIARLIYGDVRIYGFRSLTDPDADPAWAMLSSARTVMLVEAMVQQIGESGEFANIDAQGTAAGVLKSRITAALQRLKGNGVLYGLTDDDAFTVDVTTAQRRFEAALTLTVTEAGEQVKVTITNKPVEA